MANIKLKDHYWETEGIYDAAQSKTQKAINADIEEVAQNNSDLIILSSTQPSATGNKIWIKEGVSYQIPVMDDLISNNITNNSSVTGTKVTDALNTLGTDVSGLQSSLNSVETNINGLSKKFWVGTGQTPNEHLNYLDVNRTVNGKTYSHIIASIANNTTANLCAFTLSTSAFRIIVRMADGTAPSSNITLNYILTE